MLAGLLAVANRINSVSEGLNASYYPNATWSAPAAVVTVDPLPSTRRLTDAWHDAPPEVFSTTWAGSILAFSDGSYTFSSVSDDGSRVYLDGQLVVDNGGRHGPVAARGSTTLARGVHAIFIQYAQEGGGVRFELLWGQGDQPLELVPSWALAPRRVSFWGFVVRAALSRALAVAEWLWIGALLAVAITIVWTWISKTMTWFQREHVWPAIGWIIAGSLLLNFTGVWWGLPGGGWAPDELRPITVLTAAASHYSHDWFDRYPPFHCYVLTTAFSPLLLLESWGRIDMAGETAYALLAAIGRAVSLAMGVTTLIAVYACGARVFGKRAGLFSAAALAVVAPFVYYAKTANLDVPYVCWFALSLVFYLRLLEGLRTADFVGFAACATLAIVTKDQAYGLYLLTPFVIVHRLWHARHEAGVPHPLTRALLDKRLGLAALVAIVLFALSHNLAFNGAGFVEHIRYITGGASQNYRQFAPTAAGRAALLVLTLDLIRVAWGWPLFLVSVAGVFIALLAPRHRRATIWLAVPVVSYYLSFIDVVLYNYDRFMLPICVVLALFAGLALDRSLAMGRLRRWRIVGVGAVFAYSVLYAATVDALMIRDSRYRVEEWMAARIADNDLVGYVFPVQYYPRLERFKSAEISTVEQLQRDRPAYYVLNADYAQAEPTGSPTGRLIAGLQGGTLGYELAFRYRQPFPWPWLPDAHRDLIGPRTEQAPTSALRHINPTFEVFKRAR